VQTPDPTREVPRFAILFNHIQFILSRVQTPHPELCSRLQCMLLLCKGYFHTYRKEELKLQLCAFSCLVSDTAGQATDAECDGQKHFPNLMSSKHHFHLILSTSNI
jgi:hypothetical protein